MKTKKLTRTLAAFLFLLLSTAYASAQTKNVLSISKMKDCCIMTDGKMMQFKDGQLTPMKKAVRLENGTKVKRNGVCVMPDRTRVRMKEGNCIDLQGNIENCAVKDKPKEMNAS